MQQRSVLSAVDTLQALERVTQLETALAEQKLRMDKYRTMYESLKVEHVELQKANESKGIEVDQLRLEARELRKKCQDALGEAWVERDAKVQECEELRLQVPTAQRMEAMRMKVQQEVDSMYRQKMDDMDTENNRLRSDYNKMRYEFALLQSEYENEMMRQQHSADELKAQYDLQVKEIANERDELLHQISTERPAENQKLRLLQRERNQLSARLKSLEEEFESLSAAKDKLELERDQEERACSHRLSEVTLLLHSVETERDLLKSQAQRTAEELAQSNSIQEQLSDKVYLLNKLLARRQEELEDLQHKTRFELNSLQMSHQKEKEALEKDTDKFRAELSVLQTRCKTLEKTKEDVQSLIDAKVLELTNRHQTLQEESWKQAVELEEQKAALERQLEDNQSQRTDLVNQLKMEKDSKNELKRLCASLQEQHDAELRLLRAQLQESREALVRLQQEKEAFLSVKQRLSTLESEHNSLLSQHSELQTTNERQHDHLMVMSKENNQLQAELRVVKDDRDHSLSELRRQLSTKVEELRETGAKYEEQTRLHESKFYSLLQLAKRKKKAYKVELESLHLRANEADSKVFLLKEEVEKTRSTYEAEISRLHRRMEKMRQGLSHFGQMLLADSNLSGAPTSSTFLDPKVSKGTEKALRELELLRKRLDDLEETRET